MKMTHRKQNIARFQQVLFYVLLLAVVAILAKLSIDYNQQFDWTANSRHTLSASSLQLLDELEEPVQVDVFVSPDFQFRQQAIDLIERYQRHTDKLQVNYIDPNFSPDKVRQMNIQQQAEMVLSRGEQKQHVLELSEQAFTNGLLTVTRKKQPWLVFIEGHGERSLFKDSNFSMTTWAKQLRNQGFKLQALNLITQPQLPDNTAAVVIASPIQSWLPAEVSLIKQYIDNGGNLLWLTDPQQINALAPVSELLGIEFLPGTVFDPNSALLGLQDPRFVFVNDYANHSVGLAVQNVTLFADAQALEPSLENIKTDWQYTNLLNTQAESWVESNFITETNINDQQFDADSDIRGPISLGYLIERNLPELEKQQRIAVIGDSDFVSNGYIGNVANLTLSMALINWLAEDDNLITIPVKTSIGTQLQLSETASMIIGLGFLFVLPIMLLTTGLLIWWQRRRR